MYCPSKRAIGEDLHLVRLLAVLPHAGMLGTALSEIARCIGAEGSLSVAVPGVVPR